MLPELHHFPNPQIPENQQNRIMIQSIRLWPGKDVKPCPFNYLLSLALGLSSDCEVGCLKFSN